MLLLRRDRRRVVSLALRTGGHVTIRPTIPQIRFPWDGRSCPRCKLLFEEAPRVDLELTWLAYLTEFAPAVSLKRPCDGSITNMARNKRSKPQQDFVMFSREEAMAIRRACKIIEQQSDLQCAAAQRVDISAGYTSQLGNEHASEGWNRTRGPQYSRWNAGQSLAPLSYLPTPPGTNYDPQTSTGMGPSSLSISDPTGLNITPDAYSEYNFEDLTNFGLQDPAIEVLPEPLNMGFRMTLDNDNLSRHSTHHPKDRQNNIDSGGDKMDPGRQHRKRVTGQGREETGNTRDLIACIRCRQQRIKCNTNDNNPHGPCQTCTKVVNQKMYKLPCLRYKIGDTVLFREGNSPSLAWSQRWNNMTMADVVAWESPDIKFIEVSHGFCQNPIRLEVRKFVPKDGDVLERKWVDGQVRKTKRVEPYAIENMTRAAQEVKRYIYENVYPCLITFLEDHDRLVRDTYLLAYKQSTGPRDEESMLLYNVLCLWFAIRHTTASEYLCGAETLGMTPEQKDRSYPLFGKIPIAPVMGAQLELILTLEVLRPLRRKVLDQLQIMIKANKPKNWFTIYLSCFILLHSCSLATAWHYKYSRRNGVKTRYAMPDYIQELHQGANILLAHFHYCNKGSYPFRFKRNFPASIAELDEDQHRFIVKTAEYFEARKETSRKAKEYGLFEEEMYFVSQLFEEDWQPGPSV